MNNKSWQDRIKSELADVPPDPIPEEFYRGVWRQIHNMPDTNSRPEAEGKVFSFTGACFRAIPALMAVIIMFGVYSWFYPPGIYEIDSEFTEMIEPDESILPKADSLFFYIMQVPHSSESETEP
jgi:hypothetical protein